MKTFKEVAGYKHDCKTCLCPKCKAKRAKEKKKILGEITEIDPGWTADAHRQEDAPPGREKQVKSLKKKVGKDKAYAFAWAQHNKKRKK